MTQDVGQVKVQRHEVSAPIVDVSSCDRELVQFSGAIQPHGALLTIHAETLLVEDASLNTDEYFGVPTSELLGNPPRKGILR